MKYPLAITDRLIDTYGSNIMVGYDIMCAFNVTLQHSSIGKKPVMRSLRVSYPAFMVMHIIASASWIGTHCIQMVLAWKTLKNANGLFRSQMS